MKDQLVYQLANVSMPKKSEYTLTGFTKGIYQVVQKSSFQQLRQLTKTIIAKNVCKTCQQQANNILKIYNIMHDKQFKMGWNWKKKKNKKKFILQKCYIRTKTKNKKSRK